MPNTHAHPAFQGALAAISGDMRALAESFAGPDPFTVDSTRWFSVTGRLADGKQYKKVGRYASGFDAINAALDAGVCGAVAHRLSAIEAYYATHEMAAHEQAQAERLQNRMMDCGVMS